MTPLRCDRTAGCVQPAGGGGELLQGGGGSHNELFHMVFVKTTATLFTRRARGRESDRERLAEQLRAPSGVNDPMVDEESNF